MDQGSAPPEVLLDRDIRAPEILSAFTASPGYLLRRYSSIAALALIDIVSLCSAAVLVNHVRAAEDPLTERLPMYLAISSAILVAMFALHGLYGLRERRRRVPALFLAGLWSLATVVILSALCGIWAPAYILAVSLVATLLLLAGRELFDGCLRILFDLDPERKRAIILASGPRLSAIPGFDDGPRTGSKVLGMVSETGGDKSQRRNDPVPCLGRLRDIESIVERWRPDELVVADRDVELHHLVELADLCRSRRMTLTLMDLEMRFGGSGVTLIPGLGEALFVAAPLSTNGVAWVVKRWTDVASAGLLLVLTAPLQVAIAVAIKLTSRGPVFYSAERVGLGQRTFCCHKFRTMRADAEALQGKLESRNEADGAIFKLRDDPRVTRIGRLLRATSIDELPQLVNVLRGEMSLVGPRPLPLRDNELMEAWHKQRHVVLPGLTGLWQVSGRSNTSFAEMIELDLEYIDSWSLWLDLTVLWRTVSSVLIGRGAY
jgi:exopolysaccharide biosynthesis polyprenyl glycosylphosphotransferase